MKNEADFYDHHLHSVVAPMPLVPTLNNYQIQGLNLPPSCFGYSFLDHSLCMQIHWIFTGFEIGLFQEWEFPAMYRQVDYLLGLRFTNMGRGVTMLRSRSFFEVERAEEENLAETGATSEAAVANNTTQASHQGSGGGKKKKKGKRGGKNKKKKQTGGRRHGSQPHKSKPARKERLEREREWRANAVRCYYRQLLHGIWPLSQGWFAAVMCAGSVDVRLVS